MARITVYPGKLAGSVHIPASKSLAHRALICAALAVGESTVLGLDSSADLEATMKGMTALGARFGKGGSVRGGTKRQAAPVTIDCNESGSTLRFLIPIALAQGQSTRFLMRGQLGKRPLTPYYEIFAKQGIAYHHDGGVLTVEGQLQPGIFTIGGGISSQFISGLLFSLPLLPGPSEIHIEGALESREYVTLTLAMLHHFGITIQWKEDGILYIPGFQHYRPTHYRIEGDYSQAAFFLCANALGSKVILKNLRTDSAQGDKAIREILKNMGSNSVFSADGLHSQPAEQLRGTRIDASQCPDIIPVVTALAGFAQGRTEIVNGARLRIKECDRLAASREELTKLGMDITETKDGLIINGKRPIRGGETWSHNDHRIAMTLAIAATACETPVVIDAYETIEKSYPRFFADFQSLGGKLA